MPCIYSNVIIIRRHNTRSEFASAIAERLRLGLTLPEMFEVSKSESRFGRIAQAVFAIPMG